VELLGLFIEVTGLTERYINEADNKKLTAIVEYVSRNIRKFIVEKDINILRLLKNRCNDKGLIVELVKLYRATGMYYFYRNNKMFAMDKLNLAINTAREIGRMDLVAACNSDLGLIYFYEHENKNAEMQYEYVEKLLPDIPEIDKYILHLHYHRYGILHSRLYRPELAECALEKALSYAEDKTDIGFTLMDIGINYERQLNFSKALQYYNKALETFEENDYYSKSIVYNNLAELFKVIGNYGKALKYINKAFDYLNNKDASKLFIYFTTYTEIAVLLRKPEKALGRFIEMLFNMKDFVVYKSYIIENIDLMVIAGAENEKMLKRLENVVVKLIEDTPVKNHEYKKELERCLENIRLCLQDTNELKGKGGLFFEKDDN